MKKTGEFLKAERERQGVSLEDIAVTTRINMKILVAMENGDLDNLPAKTFLRGFVGSYARFLKLDSEKMLEMFHEEMGTTKPKPAPEVLEGDPDSDTIDTTDIESPSAPPKTNNDQPRQTYSNPLIKAGIAIGAVLLVIAIITVKKVIDKYDRESQINQPLEVEVLDHTNGEDMEPEVEAIVTTSTITTSTDPEKTTAETTTTKTTTTTIAPKSVVTTTSSTTTTRTTTTSVTTTTAKAAAENTQKPFEVIVEALDVVTLDFRLDGGRLKSLTLQPEQVHTFKVTKYLNVDVSDSGAVSIVYNGKDLGVPGSLGQSMKLRFPK